MKKIIALLCAGLFIMMAFTGCKKTYYDNYGNPHKVNMKHGEPVQDEYGRLIETYKDEDGKIVDYPFDYPTLLKTGRNTIENAYLKLKIPKGWSFKEENDIFRIHHDDCEDEVPCEFALNVYKEKTAEDEFIEYSIAERKVIDSLTGDRKITDYKDFTTKILGIDAKAFSSNHFGEYDFYCYFIDYKGCAFRFMFLINNKCFDGKFDPEQFIAENITLKKLPTE